MNKHIFFDNLTANIGALILGRNKFSAGSTDSQSFEELIRLTELSFPEINSEGFKKSLIIVECRSVWTPQEVTQIKIIEHEKKNN